MKDKKGAHNTYFGSVKEAIKTTVTGARVTLKHLKDAVTQKRSAPVSANDKGYFNDKAGIVTLNYPYEAIPVPDNGRYRLHNEIDDCIVCDKCAKVCPVDCIDIEAVKSPEVIGHTSDGTPRRLYAARFDIDMAKCCYCGLCTTVCPTECLTMTKTYDYSELDVENMIYQFAELTPEEAAEKQRAYDKAQEKKKEQQLKTGGSTAAVKRKPVAKPATPATDSHKGEKKTGQPGPTPRKPVVKRARPVLKKTTDEAGTSEQKQTGNTEKSGEDTAKKSAARKPVIKRAKPLVKPASTEETGKKEPTNAENAENPPEKTAPKAVKKPRPRPVIRKKKDSDNDN